MRKIDQRIGVRNVQQCVHPLADPFRDIIDCKFFAIIILLRDFFNFKNIWSQYLKFTAINFNPKMLLSNYLGSVWQSAHAGLGYTLYFDNRFKGVSTVSG